MTDPAISRKKKSSTVIARKGCPRTGSAAVAGGRGWSATDQGRRWPDTIRVLTARSTPGPARDLRPRGRTGGGRESPGPPAAAGDEDVALPIGATGSGRRCWPAAGRPRRRRPPRVDDKGDTGTRKSPPRPVLSAVLSRQLARAARTAPADLHTGAPPRRHPAARPRLRPGDRVLPRHRAPHGPGPRPPTPTGPTPRQFLLDGSCPTSRGAPRRPRELPALLVTPMLRPFTRALAPFGIVDATMPGSGKTILTSCVGLLVGQRVLTWTDADDELRKQITTVLADQVGAVVFDNLIEGHVINSAVLARLVTERTWTDRRPGTNTAATFPNDRVWLATGNNLRTGGDMASRSVWVRLDPIAPNRKPAPGSPSPTSTPGSSTPTTRPPCSATCSSWSSTGPPRRTHRHRGPADAAVHPVGPAPRGVPRHHQVPGFLTNHTTPPPGRRRRRMGPVPPPGTTSSATAHLTARDLRASAEPTTRLAPDPWPGTFPTTPAGQLPHRQSLGRLLTGQIGRWRGDIVLRSEVDKHRNCNTYWVEHTSQESP